MGAYIGKKVERLLIITQGKVQIGQIVLNAGRGVGQIGRHIVGPCRLIFGLGGCKVIEFFQNIGVIAFNGGAPLALVQGLKERMGFGIVGTRQGQFAAKIGEQPLIEEGARQAKVLTTPPKLRNDTQIGGPCFLQLAQAP